MADAARALQAVTDSRAAGPAERSPADDAALMAELVDQVVERIEARVVDELERRGRRYNPGVF